jgi:hypothetical protein
VVDLSAVVDVEDMDGAGVLLDPVDDPVGAAPGSVTARQRPEQRSSDTARVDGKSGLAEFEYGGGDRLGKPPRDGSPRGWLEPDLVPFWLGASGLSWLTARRTAYEAGRAAMLGPITLVLLCRDQTTLADDVRAGTDMPAFPKSWVDGYAVRGPGPWRVTGESWQGRPPLP